MSRLFVRGDLVVAPGFALRLTRLGRSQFASPDPLAAYVPERSTHVFALHPENWRNSFYALTLKDDHKIVWYGPELVLIRPGTLVADMAHANHFLWHGKEEDAIAYKNSVRPLDSADLSTYQQPELLIPPASCEL